MLRRRDRSTTVIATGLGVDSTIARRIPFRRGSAQPALPGAGVPAPVFRIVAMEGRSSISDPNTAAALRDTASAKDSRRGAYRNSAIQAEIASHLPPGR
jgi:hypothetical protein